MPGVVEDHYGPVRAVAVFGLRAAVGVLGLKRIHQQAGFGRSWFVPDRTSKSRQFAGRSHDRPSVLSRRSLASSTGLSKAGSSLGVGSRETQEALLPTQRAIRELTR